MTAEIEIRDAHWEYDREALRKVRHEVFVIGQNVPEDLEWDGEDVDCVHALALMDDSVVGTGRMTLTGKIGRMAVLESARGRGVGAGILRHLMGMAQSMGLTAVHLNAQTHALPFYARFGFESEGEEFDEAGIPHLHMVCSLTPETRTVFDTSDAARKATCDVARIARRSLCLFSHDLEPAIYGRSAFVDIVQQMILAHKFARIRILVVSPMRVVREGHRLVELARRFTSFIEIREAHADYRRRPDTFLLADKTAVVFRPNATRFEGNVDTHDPALARHYLDFFDTAWERSTPSAELRRLNL